MDVVNIAPMMIFFPGLLAKSIDAVRFWQRNW
jgi:hypothetical protein